MPTTVVMPKMGYDMTQGKIVRWLKHEGDRVRKGEPIAEIETEKVNIQIEAFASGILQRVVALEGETVPVGEPIALVGEPGEKPEQAPPEALRRQETGAGEGAEAPPAGVRAGAPRMEVARAEEKAVPRWEAGRAKGEAPGPRMEAGPAEAATSEEERVKASPVARRMAVEQGVELSHVPGTGPGGRITKEDVERFLTEAARRRGGAEKQPAKTPPAMRPAPSPEAGQAAPPPPPKPTPQAPAPAAAGSAPSARQPAAPGPMPAGTRAAPPTPTAEPVEGVPVETRELSRMGQAIARRMAQSKQTMPHFYATMEIDMSRVAELREELNGTLGEEEKVSFNDFVLKAVALALSRFPVLNASYAEGKLSLYQQINIAMAVALEEGLITPVLRECDRKPLLQIARETGELTAHAREGRLRQEEYQGGTFTVSNMGMLGVEEFAAIINPPQAAILAVGAVASRPVVRGGALAVAQTMKATISVDHRVTNGAEAARFLGELRRLLESPAILLL